ncbi:MULTISPECIES: DUF485 domain-containing protein [Cupriavidus]|jgi:uncharacterized membrane protein (DUF485 family)|uniref:DUF485 domain-containing protein n=1 Tax=Cupriavidus pauculus TaxID=82633 RepID=A0A5P2HF36_9BURK|nr:DUF485 domain-containing protein [Cupriavidus pauculus]QET06123.1 DUF485 domain-containing protein [Cupriavidus pauculus]
MIKPSPRAYEALYQNPEFQRLVRTRRRVVLTLFAISMTMFFAVPVLAGIGSSLFEIRVTASTNFGLWYLCGQYFVGGVIAWAYAAKLRRLDAMADALISQAPSPEPEAAHAVAA